MGGCVCVLSVALLERQSLVAANRTSCPPGHGISLLTWSGWRNIQWLLPFVTNPLHWLMCTNPHLPPFQLLTSDKDPRVETSCSWLINSCVLLIIEFGYCVYQRNHEPLQYYTTCVHLHLPFRLPFSVNNNIMILYPTVCHPHDLFNIQAQPPIKNNLASSHFTIINYVHRLVHSFSISSKSFLIRPASAQFSHPSNPTLTVSIMQRLLIVQSRADIRLLLNIKLAPFNKDLSTLHGPLQTNKHVVTMWNNQSV